MVTNRDRVGNTLQKSIKLNLGSGSARIREAIQRGDRDWYQFTLGDRRSVNLALQGLKADVDLKLFKKLNKRSQLLQTSAQRGNVIETINADLEAGTYYIQVYPGRQLRGKKSTSYRLEVVATPVPPPPPPAQAELNGNSFNVVQDALNAGSIADVQFRVNNSGNAPTGAFNVQFYLSQDPTITSTDLALGSYLFSNGLAANTVSDTIAQPLLLPSISDSYWSGSKPYYIGMIVDSTNVVNETNETNNAGTGDLVDYNSVQVNFPPPPQPELAGNAFNISQDALKAGEPATIGLRVNNSGTGAAGAFTVQIYLSNDATITSGDRPLGNYRFTNGLAANTVSDLITQSLTLPDINDPYWIGSGQYYIGMVIDTTNEVSETNEGNNTGIGTGVDVDFVQVDTSPVQNPPDPVDLKGRFFNTPVSGTPGTPIILTFRAENLGSVTAGAFKAGFYLSSDQTITTSDLRLGEYAFTELAGNTASSSLTKTVTLPAATNGFWTKSGTYYIGMITDDTNQITETNESNNANVGFLIDSVDIQVDIPSRVDLKGSSFNAEEPLVAGQTFTVDFSVQNTGSLATENFWVDFYLSTDTTITDTDRQLDYRRITTVAANSSTGTLTQTLTLPPVNDPFWQGNKIYYIGMITDALDGISESNESNNRSTGSLIDYDGVFISNTQAIADLKGVSLDSPEPLVAGETVDVSFNIQNAGNVAANGFWVDFYLSPDPTISASSAGISGDKLVGYDYISSLAAGGQTGSLNATITLPTDSDPFWNQVGDGTYYIGMIVDAFDDINESNENNNSNTPTLGFDRDAVPISGTQPRIDLVGHSFSLSSPSINAGQTVTATYKLQNLGSGSAGTFKTKFYLSDNSYISGLSGFDYFLGEQVINALPGSNTTGNLTKSLTLPGIDDRFWNLFGDGTYYIGMVVDAEEAIAETEESNNSNTGLGIDYKDIAISNTKTPTIDLRGIFFSTPDTLIAGNSFNSSFTVRNGGTGTSGNFKVGFYLSADDTLIESTDFFLGESEFNSLTAGADTGFLTKNLTLPGASNAIWQGNRSYSIGMIVDYASTVTETDETNNRNRGLLLDYDTAQITIPPSVRTLKGTLGADSFTYQSGFSRTIISGNGNVDYGAGSYDTLNLSTIPSSSVTFNYANTTTGGVVFNPGNGARVFDAITLSNGNEILFEGIERIRFSDRVINLLENVTPNDPEFSKQWNLHMMAVPSAWRFTQGAANVLVGVGDTGLGLNNNTVHPDLRTTSFVNSNIADDFSRFNTSHGTSVQGIIAANTNNGVGISGINWNSPVYNIDVISGADPGDYNLQQATQTLLNSATANGQKLIVNLSLSVLSGDLSGFTQLVADNQSNVLFVVAAGNEDRNYISSPASLALTYNNVVAVGASWGRRDKDGNSKTPGTRISYPFFWGSNYGAGLTVMGPSEVYATDAISQSGTVSFNYATKFNGTSAATPNVAGVASLIWSANANLTATQVKTILSQTAFDLGTTGYDTEYGSGFVNADAAVRRAIAIGKGFA